MSLLAIKESYKTKRCSYGSTLPHSAMTQAWYHTTSQGPLGISDVLKKKHLFLRRCQVLFLMSLQSKQGMFT